MTRGIAEGAFAELGIEESRHGFLHLVDEFVNDTEELDLDALALGGVGGRVVRLGVETDDHGSRGLGEEDVGLGDRSDG